MPPLGISVAATVPRPPSCLFLVGLALGACAPPPIPAEDSGSSAPSVRITWPPPETAVQGCEIVTVDVENFDLVEFPTEADAPGRGHYHIYHPGGYEACYKPWCFVDFSSVTETNEPYLVAVLADSSHDELVGENGEPIQDRVPIEFVPGSCELPGGAGYATAGHP